MRFASLILVAGLLAGGPASAFDPYSQTEIMTVLVVGATGQQGGAVAREWLRRGYQVRGLTRNPASPRARASSHETVALRPSPKGRMQPPVQE